MVFMFLNLLHKKHKSKNSHTNFITNTYFLLFLLTFHFCKAIFRVHFIMLVPDTLGWQLIYFANKVIPT